MGSIIDKLMEIEAVASRIRESVSFRKQELLNQMKNEKKIFDQQLAEESQVQLKKNRQELQKKYQEDVEAIRKEADGMSQKMQVYFEQQHVAWADEIFEKIIGM